LETVEKCEWHLIGYQQLSVLHVSQYKRIVIILTVLTNELFINYFTLYRR